MLSFSFSGQTSAIVRKFVAALEARGHEITKERLIPCRSLKFPVGSYVATFKMMLTTFFRQRIPIEPLSKVCYGQFDLIILAGPTWSYNPSGPVLSLLDRDGCRLFKDQTVLPLISCRGYWRMHCLGLKSLLKRYGATVPNCIVFSHPSKEPWRTVGVFLKIAGKTPERSPWLGRFYKRFGHSREQLKEAAKLGEQLGKALSCGDSLTDINFHTDTALP